MILEKEVRHHRLFSLIGIITGLGLLGLGLTLAYFLFYTSLGYLLILVGILRIANSLYDLQREDRLKGELKRLERKFGST